MVLLRLLTDPAPGTEHRVRRFPLRLGRAADAGLRLTAHGVWERHAELRVHQGRELVLAAEPDAPVRVNGHPVTRAVLRTGDVIDLGGARLQFSLASPAPRGLRLREALTWAGLGAVFALQIALIYWLLR
ncbi:MAG: FHA domain-containing protein [Verrucomicrobia bacterium]|nr:FHA domain-containing protein [Verrucomicrobiota bacterium]